MKVLGLLTVALISGLTALGVWGFVDWVTSARPKRGEVKTYNVMLLNTEFKTSSWKATHITNNGFCTTLWKWEVADTVICHPHIVTEANGEEEPTASQSKVEVGNAPL